MPFNRAFREKQRELKAKNKNKGGKGVRSGAIGGGGGGGYVQFPEQDIHCKGMTVHITGRLDKYGNWVRD